MPYRYNPLTSKLDYYENIIRYDETDILPEKQHFIAFDREMPSDKYTLIIRAFDDNGNEVDYRFISQGKKGFNIQLYFPSKIHYVATYKAIQNGK